MKVMVRFNRANHIIELPEDSKVENLKEQVEKLLQVPANKQKIVFKGKTLAPEDQGLSALSVVNGSKLLLFGSAGGESDNEQEKSVEKVSTCLNMYRDPPQIDEQIVALGAPKGALPNFQADVSVLPQTPFVIRTNKGVAKMNIETNAFFLQYDENKENNPQYAERIFFSDMSSCAFIQDKPDDYVHIAFYANSQPVIFYFIPNQYKRTLLKILRAQTC